MHISSQSINPAQQSAEKVDVASRPVTLDESLLLEFLASANLAAMTGSYVLGRAQGNHVLFAGPITFILPPAPQIFPALERGLIESPFEPKLLERLMSFYHSVRVATRLTAAACHDPAYLRIPATVDWARLAPEWTTVAEMGLAFAECARVMHRVDAGLEADLLAMAETMRTLRRGGLSNVAKDGFLFLGGYLDRRREARVKRSDIVDVSSNAGTERARLFDVARSGLGLEGITLARQGMPVTLSVRGREPMLGFIVWADRRRAGVRLSHPLTPADPLLRPDNRVASP